MARVDEAYELHPTAMDANGDYTKMEIIYVVKDIRSVREGEVEALKAVKEEVPDVWKNLRLDAIEITSRDNDNIYHVTVTYQKQNFVGSRSDRKNSEEATVSFDCGGGTMRRTHAIRQRRVYGDIDAGGAIGWNGKTGSEMEITGVEIPTAQLRETYTKELRLARITTRFRKVIASLIGKINSSSFKGWEPGEVMFMGMSYSSPAKLTSHVMVTYSFAIRPNESNAKIGNIPIGHVKGWDYVWALSESVMDSGTQKMKPKAIYVDQVSEYADFSVLGL